MRAQTVLPPEGMALVPHWALIASTSISPLPLSASPSTSARTGACGLASQTMISTCSRSSSTPGYPVSAKGISMRLGRAWDVPGGVLASLVTQPRVPRSPHEGRGRARRQRPHRKASAPGISAAGHGSTGAVAPVPDDWTGRARPALPGNPEGPAKHPAYGQAHPGHPRPGLEGNGLPRRPRLVSRRSGTPRAGLSAPIAKIVILVHLVRAGDWKTGCRPVSTWRSAFFVAPGYTVTAANVEEGMLGDPRQPAGPRSYVSRICAGRTAPRYEPRRGCRRAVSRSW